MKQIIKYLLFETSCSTGELAVLECDDFIVDGDVTGSDLLPVTFNVQVACKESELAVLQCATEIWQVDDECTSVVLSTTGWLTRFCGCSTLFPISSGSSGVYSSNCKQHLKLQQIHISLNNTIQVNNVNNMRKPIL